jgi:hypothetical protein
VGGEVVATPREAIYTRSRDRGRTRSGGYVGARCLDLDCRLMVSLTQLLTGGGIEQQGCFVAGDELETRRLPVKSQEDSGHHSYHGAQASREAASQELGNPEGALQKRLFFLVLLLL